MRAFFDCKLASPVCLYLLIFAWPLQLIASVLADDFQPTVTWFCPSDAFELTLRTTQPFFGAIHAIDRYQACRMNGTGETETHYRIAFKSWKECNVKYSQADDTYSVQIEVNEHPVLILQQDRIFDLVCEGRRTVAVTNASTLQHANTRNSQTSHFHISFELNITGADGVFDEVTYGEPYFLRVQIKDDEAVSSPRAGFRVTVCHASGADNATVKLTDSHGCSMDRNLISDFLYKNGRANAKIASMFRFPNTDKIHFKCTISVCNDEFDCATSCARRSDASFKDGAFGDAKVTQLLSDNYPDEADHLDERRHLVTATVTVKNRAQNPISSQHVGEASFIAASVCVPPSDLIVLYKLCVVLCVMFLVGCCINIIFCIYVTSNNSQNTQKREVIKSKPIGISNHTTNDFWIKDSSVPSAGSMGIALGNEINGNFVSGQNRRSSLGSYASIRQKAHRCLGQLPVQFNSDPLDTPSSTSPASQRPSTFGSRPYMTNSTTMETDLNSPHSSVMTERNTADFSRNDGFPLHPNTESAIFSNIHQSERESFSIL
uniref:ZP domain-containing protein n=1 Tax=Parascaris univalens TaxID=6257 RepID=A0A915BMK1_PARUN